jgi:hypothetical protein
LRQLSVGRKLSRFWWSGAFFIGFEKESELTTRARCGEIALVILLTGDENWMLLALGRWCFRLEGEDGSLEKVIF